MMSSESKIEALAGELGAGLARFAPGSAGLEAFLTSLCDALGAINTCCFTPVVAERGWSLQGALGAGALSQSRLRALRLMVQDMPADEPFVASYDPYAVSVPQRNVALTLRGMEQIGVLNGPALHTVSSNVLRLPHDAMRVLVCDGPRLVAWVGVLREEPFRRAEVRLLQRLVEPLGQHLRLAQHLRSAGVYGAALEIALEALAVPAFVVGPRYSIELANTAGAQLLASQRSALFAQLRASERNDPAAPFSITQLAGAGTRGYMLAIGKTAVGTRGASLARAKTLWRLSPKQTRVLELVADGQSNKDVARELGCAEVTVEQHLTRIFRASGAKNRTDLIGRLTLF